MDKGTEYFVSLATKTRAPPLALLIQFVILTSRKIRYLRIDSGEEFQSDKITEFCAGNDVVLQLVVAYDLRCKPTWRVQLAASKRTAERLCSTLTTPPVSRMTRTKIST